MVTNPPSGDVPASANPGEPAPAAESRREVLSSAVMAGGLALGYGTFAYMAGRFLYPEGAGTAWSFVAPVASLGVGESKNYRTPTGEGVVIVRRARDGVAGDFLALSAVCPHLGCRVHWEEGNQRFFCPCHNGVFDPNGNAISGPPAKAGQWLRRYPLRVERGLLYIEVPVVRVAAHDPRAGHDPCLARGVPRTRRDESV